MKYNLCLNYEMNYTQSKDLCVFFDESYKNLFKFFVIKENPYNCKGFLLNCNIYFYVWMCIIPINLYIFKPKIINVFNIRINN